LKPEIDLSLRNRLRLALVPLAARLGRIAGRKWTELGERLGREVVIGQLNAAGPARTVDAAAKPLDVVFFTMISGNHRLSNVEVVLSRALRARGHRVRFVVCDQCLPVCEVKWNELEHRWPDLCGRCYGYGRRLLSATGCEPVPLSSLLEGADLGRTRSWDGYVESAILKHYHVGVLEDTPAISERRKLFAGAAAISETAALRIAEQRPDRVIMSHGIYCTWGPAREVFIDAGIPVCTYAEGKKKDTLKFNWNTSADWWDVSAEWDRVKDTPLTPRQQAVIDEYLLSRREHSQDARVYNFGREEKVTETRQRLRLDPDKPTFVLFTNVLWDAASAQREIAFSNPVQWVLDTIEWFAARPDRQLVVKIHPAEVVIGTNQPFAGLIAQRFDRLPANVRVIEPHEDVNSWSVMRVADLGLAHTSTVGMELPLEGIPCLVVSRTHFRGRGFTVDVNSREEYFDLLDAWDGSTVDRVRLMELSKRYAYLLFERYQLPFPFLHERVVNDVRALTLVDERELLAHPTMKLFIESFENGRDWLLPD
jgi:hypothetical protein